MAPSLAPGLRAHLDQTVGDADTALALSSGDVTVLATPRLLAWAEEATCRALAPALDTGTTSVGVHVELDHLAPSPVGEHVRVEAELVGVEDRRLEFVVRAVHPADGREVARGRVVRSTVDRERFLARLVRKPRPRG
jgi:fluoroacetyl-CoA thioesterase